jgi:catechol 2,3-dioxygenase-like lactoylglutathione lyase family enzyme
MSEFIERARGLDLRGQMTRRELMVSLGAIGLAPVLKLAAQPATPPIPVSTISHVALTVADFKRTVDFYQRLFGLSVLTYQGPPTYRTPGESETGREYPMLGIPGPRPQFLVLSGGRGAGTIPSINHFCLGVEKFDPDRAANVLKERNIRGRVRMREGQTPELLYYDPDGILFQMQDVSYCGGSGRLGNVCDPKERPFPTSASATPPPANPPIRPRTINSFGISVSNFQRSLDFYQGLFGTPIQTYQGETALLSIASGPRPQFFAISPGDYRTGKYVAPPSLTAQSPITHFCVGIEGFNAERVVKILAENGVKADLRMREGRTPEVFLWDPDNIRVQIQDVGYCGGSGPLGSLCNPKDRPLEAARKGVQG